MSPSVARGSNSPSCIRLLSPQQLLLVTIRDRTTEVEWKVQRGRQLWQAAVGEMMEDSEEDLEEDLEEDMTETPKI